MNDKFPYMFNDIMDLYYDVILYLVMEGKSNE